MAEKEVIDALIQNNLELQRKSADLIDAVSKLTSRMKQILDVFESAARAIEKGEVEEPLAKKLGDLLEQNKTIARGLLLLEKYVREKTTPGFQSSFQSSRPLQKSEL
ncbi:MAG: hypothetical protein Q7R96_01385 [Nanoarchaeota archaeon]|nr:hypothetical protein [Nanoarchaeota archaeon]